MAVIHAIGEPVNDGERQVLVELRGGLDDSWHVVANFWIQQATRSYECDALVVSPNGWAYIVEVKAWIGQIRGNDSQWEIPALSGEGFIYPPNPVELTHRKGQILADVLRKQDPPLKAVFVQPLVVIVSDTPPDLEGRCAENTVLIGEMLPRVQIDPREYKRRVPADVGKRAAEVLVHSHRPLAPPTVIGQWQLLEQAEVGPRWEIWSARLRLGGSQGRVVRLKRYTLDPLAVGGAARLQVQQARRDLESLERLAGAEGAVPLVNSVEEIDNSLIVVTEWPHGESLASLLAGGELSPHLAEEAFLALVKAVASVHREGVVHRNLTPRCAHLLEDGRVVLTDFDYARIPDVETGITNVIQDELDVAFLAPEVRGEPQKASKTSDVWSLARIGLVLFGGGSGETTADPGRVPARWRSAFEQALEPDPAKRPRDAELFYKQLLGESEIAEDLFDGFHANDEIEDRFVVRSDPVGEGGIARVYRVYDAIAERDCAAKFVKREYDTIVDPAEEYRLLLTLPDHPLIVKPEFVDQMTHFRRGGQVYSFKTVFVVTRWVEGTRLDRLVGQNLPPVRTVELVLDLADAAAHLHRNGLVHRDLKPQNVIVDARDGRPRLVDFNVSGRMEAVGRTETGTKLYRPPDLGEVAWGPDADAYAISVILCEMLAGRRLGEGVREWVAGATHLAPALRAALDRGTAPRQADRWPDAPGLAAELQGVLVELRQPLVSVPEASFPEAPTEDVNRPDWNPYQHRLVSLFSQSSTTNTGTRGLDEFARWAYVETRIDRDLFADIAQGVPRLVVITGNAGDGKTAFIQMVETRLAAQGGLVERRPMGNGSTVTHGTRRLVTNLDGSQDEGDRENDDVLAEFFGPFSGESPSPDEGETRLIAINEGRLRDFLSVNRDVFPWLERTVRSLLLGGGVTDADWLRFVNLNLRALTLPAKDDEAIVSRLLSRFADQRLWDPCSGCRALAHCYAHANAAALRDPILGPRASERIRQTLDLIRLRRRMHITMRDLRSALAYVVAGNRTCEEIVRLVEENDSRSLLAGHLYNAMFAASDKLDPPAVSDAATRDRLLALVGTLDVAKTADPQDDARLWMSGTSALRPEPPSLERRDRELIHELRERLPYAPAELEQDRARSDLRLVQASLRRKLFLEREDPDWLAMFPYARLGDFLRLLDDGCTDIDRADVIRAISNSEGLFNDEFAGQLAVRLVAEGDGADRSFVLHAEDGFVLLLRDESDAAIYVEYAPDGLRLDSKAHDGVRLDIDLDLYETLMRVKRGFTPSREELRGAWLNLRIFKEQLASVPSESLLLSRDDRRFFKVSRVRDENAVEIEAASP